ncbi:hypothetical protein [Treponema primitia]|uniref:hypothetical protein n=1 Tax=Treponema primitia TaxID=88058 RepID=UPI0002FD440C|nr:hypothetical protein [Treponema primitia]
MKKHGRLIGTMVLLLFVFIIFPECQQQTDPRDIELVGTKWTWSGTLLEFKSGAQAEVLDSTYSYTYDHAARQGEMQTLGTFRVSADFRTLTFTSYNNGGGEAVFERQEEEADPGNIVPMESLVGTRWRWNSGGYGMRTLYFESAEIVQFQDQYTDTEPWLPYNYTYSKTTKKGQIEIFGKFTVSADNQRISFAQWRSYPHGAEYDRIED